MKCNVLYSRVLICSPGWPAACGTSTVLFHLKVAEMVCVDEYIYASQSFGVCNRLRVFIHVWWTKYMDKYRKITEMRADMGTQGRYGMKILAGNRMSAAFAWTRDAETNSDQLNDRRGCKQQKTRRLLDTNVLLKVRFLKSGCDMKMGIVLPSGW